MKSHRLGVINLVLITLAPTEKGLLVRRAIPWKMMCHIFEISKWVGPLIGQMGSSQSLKWICALQKPTWELELFFSHIYGGCLRLIPVSSSQNIAIKMGPSQLPKIDSWFSISMWSNHSKSWEGIIPSIQTFYFLLYPKVDKLQFLKYIYVIWIL